MPNESVEMTQLLCYKNPKLWSLQAIDALNYNQVHNSFKVSSICYLFLLLITAFFKVILC